MLYGRMDRKGPDGWRDEGPGGCSDSGSGAVRGGCSLASV